MLTAVRVVQVDLEQPEEAVAALDATLAVSERQGSREARVARAAARHLLARELGIAPAAVEISRHCAHCGDPAHGKPFVIGDQISFSLTHSGSLGCVAIAPAGVRLGVDVEAVRERVRLHQLAARVCAPAELAAWESLPVDEQLAGFFALWTAKEAYLKATGKGITSSLADVPPTLDGWDFRPLGAMPNGYVGALAVDRAEIEVVSETWVFNPNGGIAG
jgi:4'-phosphopantetheinyl transferase